MANKEADYQDTTINCSCGKVFHVKSTMKEKHVDVCSACHPFYTGELAKVRHAGQVDKFNKKYGFTSEQN